MTAGGLSVGSTANELFADPAAKAVLAKYIGDKMWGFENALSSIGSVTMLQLSKMSSGALSKDDLANIKADLKALSFDEDAGP